MFRLERDCKEGALGERRSPVTMIGFDAEWRREEIVAREEGEGREGRGGEEGRGREDVVQLESPVMKISSFISSFSPFPPLIVPSSGARFSRNPMLKCPTTMSGANREKGWNYE